MEKNRSVLHDKSLRDEVLTAVMEQSPLFDGISSIELKRLLSCLDGQVRTFSKKEIIISEADPVTAIGFVIEGKVVIQQDDYWGNTAILTKLGAGDLFAEAYVCGKMDHFPISAVAVEDTEILMLNYQQVLRQCSRACGCHARFIENLMQAVAEKNIRLVQKLSFLTKRTTREKVLSYLSAEAKRNRRTSFEIPFNRQELADFLSVDRSALSKELSKMQEEGLLSYHKNSFRLY